MNNSIVYLKYIDLLKLNENYWNKLCKIFKKIRKEKNISDIQRKILLRDANRFIFKYIFNIFDNLRFWNIDSKTKWLVLIFKYDKKNDIFSVYQKKRIYLYLKKIYASIIKEWFNDSKRIIDFYVYVLQQKKFIKNKYSPFYIRVWFKIINNIILKIKHFVLYKDFYIESEILYNDNFINNHNYISSSYSKTFLFKIKMFFSNKKIYKIYKKKVNYDFGKIKIIKKIWQNDTVIIKFK